MGNLIVKILFASATEALSSTQKNVSIIGTVFLISLLCLACLPRSYIKSIFWFMRYILNVDIHNSRLSLIQLFSLFDVRFLLYVFDVFFFSDVRAVVKAFDV